MAVSIAMLINAWNARIEGREMRLLKKAVLNKDRRLQLPPIVKKTRRVAA